MALDGCGEQWSSQSAGVTVWLNQSSSLTAWDEATTYCPVTSGAFYNSSTISYDDATTDYDAT